LSGLRLDALREASVDVLHPFSPRVALQGTRETIVGNGKFGKQSKNYTGALRCESGSGFAKRDIVRARAGVFRRLEVVQTHAELAENCVAEVLELACNKQQH
jgi:hypothetical protein